MGRRGRVPPPDPGTAYVEVADRYVRVADEDDDRRIWVSENGGPQREVFANRRYERMESVGGWHPPFNLSKRDRRTPLQGNFEWTDGYFWVTMSRRGAAWTIRCWGNDDFGLERTNLSERTARNLWAQINNFTTRRTLDRLGFVPV